MRKTLTFFGSLLLLSATQSGLGNEPRSPMPKGNLGEWATAKDYPNAALRAEIEGVVRFQLAVDSKGKVTGCSVRETSGSAELDAKTCELMLDRARFVLASDESGKSAAGTWSSSVRWEIPLAKPIMAASGAPKRNMIFEEGGGARWCRVRPRTPEERALKACTMVCSQPFDASLSGSVDAPEVGPASSFSMRSCRFPG